MIKLNNLQKSYKKLSVLNISELTIPAGQSFGLVGNNGAGKTTLLRLLLDLIRASEGYVEIDGQAVTDSEEWKNFTGSFIDEKFLISYLTPEEYFQFIGRIRGVSDGDVESHLKLFEPLFNDEIFGKKKYIRDLSKGNKKKLGVAAALLGDPKLVILDEPFENLDPTSQIRLKKIIQQFQAEKSVTFLISSHDLNHVTEICERIVILDQGEIVKDIPVTNQTLQELTDYFGENAEV
ncbi:ABC-2 type transport system ATP-binding protein [Marivirga sericea]|uniref:ABC-2 type transport system ATP-binding protein n=1 Tax=Marivirga sericea TaxID=1028 RepID=A0A1X7LAE2_9BACT|nr:ABC transporter ATP-binding protein [Marivirga sericea]SMG50801.1 ABC-2 type transport system ATP-binding protein [Marivirga sericea]